MLMLLQITHLGLVHADPIHFHLSCRIKQVEVGFGRHLSTANTQAHISISECISTRTWTSRHSQQCKKPRRGKPGIQRQADVGKRRKEHSFASTCASVQYSRKNPA